MEPLKKIAESYAKAEPNVKLVFNFAASGTLQTQIEQGLDADVFFSASKKNMDALEAKGLLLENTKVNLLENKVVLIVPASSTKGISSFNDCMTPKVSLIAIGDPAITPLGQYAEEIFTYLNGWDSVRKKASLGYDIKQVISWVESGTADCGIVFSTEALLTKKVKIVAEAPSGSVSPVVFSVSAIKASRKKDAASAFIKFLQSEDASKIFTSYGFSLVK